jgi:hypothetical protein
VTDAEKAGEHAGDSSNKLHLGGSIQVCVVYFDLAALDIIFIQSGLIVDANEDDDAILGFLEFGLGGDLLRLPYNPGASQNLRYPVVGQE